MGFFLVDIATGVGTFYGYPDWGADFLQFDTDGDTPGVYSFEDAVYEPTTEKFWAGRRNEGDQGHFEPPDTFDVWYYTTEGFGIYGWEAVEATCPPPCEEDLTVCGDTTEPAVNCEWPFDTLKPRHVGIHMVPATLGGGPALVGGLEDVQATNNGFWRISFGDIYIRTAEQVRAFRRIECCLEGRGGVVRLPIYDGKRAPWLSTPGGAIAAEAEGPFAVWSTSGSIRVTSGGELLAGMPFSISDRLYRLITVGDPTGQVYLVTIWPPIRVAIADNAVLEFRRPVLRCRLKDDDGMLLNLDLLRNDMPSVDFEEDI